MNNIFFFFFSTKSMREDGEFEVIKKPILKPSLRHQVHIEAYGEGNETRLTGRHESASINTFSWVNLKVGVLLRTWIHMW
ncbi:putative glutamine synthetase [Medicago truncatula]|uniref:Glutamate--ammonia ligase n=1 Tax=Medicago truncatula TaxID=3880 RepID=A0A396GNX8_MEDTR|nr:putative glutamine synthetase [Medicago truncatula]